MMINTVQNTIPCMYDLATGTRQKMWDSPLDEEQGVSLISATNISMTNVTPFEENDARWCYVEGKPDSCVRVAILLTLAIVTGVLCSLRIIQYHYHREKNSHQYLIYYIALLISLLSIIHWSYVRTAVLDFVNTYFSVIQLLVISHFFLSWASRILQHERSFNYVIFPLLVVTLLYFTAAVFWACLTVQEVEHECTRPQWLLFSTSQLVMVQLFLVAVVYITRKLNHVRTSRTNRLSQKAQLWGLTIVYEIVSIGTFAYDLYLVITRHKDDDCGTIFTSNSAGITVIYIIHKIVKYLLAQWAIVLIFSPKRQSTDSEDTREALSWAGKPNYQSIFFQTSDSPGPEEHDRLLPYLITPSTSSINGPSSVPRSSYPAHPSITPLSPHGRYASSWLKTTGQGFPVSHPAAHS